MLDLSEVPYVFDVVDGDTDLSWDLHELEADRVAVLTSEEGEDSWEYDMDGESAADDPYRVGEVDDG
jgi:hypothetical protein